jgi:hypothetical protein
MNTLPTDYSHQQLVDALSAEYEFLCHEDFDPDVDMSQAEYVDYLNTLSIAQLIAETDTDDNYTLEEYIFNHS